jgi:hypothetical protein
MGEANFLVDFDLVAFADPRAGSRPLTDAVDRKHRRLVEGRAKERAGGV